MDYNVRKIYLDLLKHNGRLVYFCNHGDGTFSVTISTTCTFRDPQGKDDDMVFPVVNVYSLRPKKG